jgi:hypothetical protein
MFITHRFADHQTLDRARYWLTRFGFAASQMEVHEVGIPHISLRAPLSEIAEAELLFAALESADPVGRPGFWDAVPHSDHDAPEVDGAGPLQARGKSVVGWHPLDVDLMADPQIRALREAFGN